MTKPPLLMEDSGKALIPCRKIRSNLAWAAYLDVEFVNVGEVMGYFDYWDTYFSYSITSYDNKPLPNKGQMIGD